MKLPIIDSIMFGSLYPDLYIVQKTIDGKTKSIPCTASEIWDLCQEQNIFPMVYNAEDDNNNPSYRPLERPETELDYQSLANAFSKLPTTLSGLEKLCIQHLSYYVTFNFENERPVNLSQVIPHSYTPISKCYYPVDFQLFDYTPKHPFAMFYQNIIRTEMERVKLALLDYVQVTQSDIATKGEVEDTLSSMLDYAMMANGKQGSIKVFSFDPLREVSSEETDQSCYEFNIFPMLQSYLIKTYFEIEILFRFLLKRDIEQDFDDVVYKCYRQYPPEPSKMQLQLALMIQAFQHHITINKTSFLVQYHPFFIHYYQTFSNDKAFIDVFKATENAIYLNNAADFSQLINEKYCKSQFLDKMKVLEKRINTLSNPREIKSILEDELYQLDLFADSTITIPSIPRQMYKWISDRLKLVNNNIGSILVPVSDNAPSTRPGKQPREEMPLERKIEIANKHLLWLSGCNEQNEQITSNEDYARIIEKVSLLLSTGTVPTVETRIRTKTTAACLRYSFYQIYNELNLKTPSRDSWIDLLHALFPQLDHSDKFTTTNKHFSTKPKGFDKKSTKE